MSQSSELEGGWKMPARFHQYRPELQPPAIISVALTGAVPTKASYPSLPVSPSEIADQALACAELGASIAHLHMRDADGRQTQSKELLTETIRQIRRGCDDLIICATTTSRGASNPNDRLTPFTLAEADLPDLASITLGSYNTPTGVNANSAEGIDMIAKEMRKTGVKPEVEIFEPGMLHYYFYLAEKNLLDKPALFNILLGVRGAAAAEANSLVNILNLVPEGSEWAVAGIGHFQRPMAILGSLMGGNLRVGMEDDPRGERPGWSNVDSLRRAVEIVDFVGRSVASRSEARHRLGLN